MYPRTGRRGVTYTGTGSPVDSSGLEPARIALRAIHPRDALRLPKSAARIPHGAGMARLSGLPDSCQLSWKPLGDFHPEWPRTELPVTNLLGTTQLDWRWTWRESNPRPTMLSCTARYMLLPFLVSPSDQPYTDKGIIEESWTLLLSDSTSTPLFFLLRLRLTTYTGTQQLDGSGSFGQSRFVVFRNCVRTSFFNPVNIQPGTCTIQIT